MHLQQRAWIDLIDTHLRITKDLREKPQQLGDACRYALNGAGVAGLTAVAWSAGPLIAEVYDRPFAASSAPIWVGLVICQALFGQPAGVWFIILNGALLTSYSVRGGWWVTIMVFLWLVTSVFVRQWPEAHRWLRLTAERMARRIEDLRGLFLGWLTWQRTQRALDAGEIIVGDFVSLDYTSND